MYVYLNIFICIYLHFVSVNLFCYSLGDVITFLLCSKDTVNPPIFAKSVFQNEWYNSSLVTQNSKVI